jgi:hypothetical protein
MSDDFQELVRELRGRGLSIDAPYFHGLLTGYATTPDPDPEVLRPEIGGERPVSILLLEKIFYYIELLSENLSANEYQALFRADREDEPERWLEGYFRAVELHEEQWEEENENHPKAGMAFLVLRSLIDPNIRRVLDIKEPGEQELREHPELVTQLVQAIYIRYYNDLDDEFDLLEGLPPIPSFPRETLEAMDEKTLFAVITHHEDRLPLEVVQECAGRGEAMVPLLLRHLTREANWSMEVDSGDGWALLHSIFILGLIPGEGAAEALLEGFRRVTFYNDNDLSDWVSGYWPALFRNKSEYAAGPLRAIAEDRQLGWYPRVNAIACVLADAERQGPEQLEAKLDWFAAFCADASEPADLRVIAGHQLLEFARERHRPIMEELVALQEGDDLLRNSYDLKEIERHFDEGDNPEWRCFDNPWEFYDREQIEQRRRDRLWEQREQEEFLSDIDHETFVREQPKIGRNDPCPCGSGKKYKKCCLRRLH